MRLAAAGDIGLSWWRHPELDSSLELLHRGPRVRPARAAGDPLEDADARGAARRGLPAVRRVHSTTWPTWRPAALDPAVFDLAASRTSAAAASFALDQRGRAAAHVPGAGGARRRFPRALPSGAPLRVVIAGHDLKFFNSLIDYFRLQPDLEVRVDHWAALGEHDEAKSRELAEWADVIVCEWCGPNAVWYSQAQAPLRAAPGAPAPVRAQLAVPGAGQVRQRRPGDLRVRLLRAAHQGEDRLRRRPRSSRCQTRSTCCSSTGPSSTARGSTSA